jgi:hypothetical protein
MKGINQSMLCAVLALGAVLVSKVDAHHSFATFDMTKQQTLRGTIKDIKWQNPHVWIYLAIDANGQQEEWEIEGGSIVGLKREGWSKDSYQVGDKVSITIHPRRDGTHGGSYLVGITADGKTLGHADQQQVTGTATPTP